MYSQQSIRAAAKAIESKLPIKLKEHSIAEIDEWTFRLNSIVDPTSTEKSFRLKRPLTEEERQFIANETLLCKISYPYFATRYCFILRDKGGEQRLRFWESQEYILEVIAELEDASQPILIINLKARQLGASTIYETILTHRVITTPGIVSLIAADEPVQSEHLFNMCERIYNHLPFYLKPHREFHVKGSQMFFDGLDSKLLVDIGNKKVGGIGQGKTIHCGHLSELATWVDMDQITKDLLPAVMSGLSSQTFFVMESTAEGEGNTWHNWWRAAKRGVFHNFTPLFIPWYAIKEKYAAEPPVDWHPSDVTMAKANSLVSKVALSRKQLYWWEQKYNSYKADNKLNEFFAEYCSDDEEAFQSTGRSIFSVEDLQKLKTNALGSPYLAYEFLERSI